jgi:tripeptide aminopeptidase
MSHALVDADAAVATLMRLLAIEGTTGHEDGVSRELNVMLRDFGVPPKAIRSDDAHSRIPVPTPCGNLWVELPGTRPGKRRLFSAHMDTVPLCAGVKPEKHGNKIISSGNTALGGDDRTGVAVLVTMIQTLLKHDLPHPPLTLLFTVREESGLYGARHVHPDDLDGITMGFNFDGRSASDVTIGAIGAERWDVEIQGKAAHAGVAPETGISATAIASLAIAEVYKGGWFGKVVKGEQRGTSNIGSLAGPTGGSAGDATNVVTDYVMVKGESRSHDAKFAKVITTAYKTAFVNAGRLVTDAAGKTAKVKFNSRVDYTAFHIKETAPVVKVAEAAVKAIGLEPKLKIADGGLDANWFIKHGVPVVTLGAGQNAIHTVDEYVDIPEFVRGCRLAVALATADDAA